MFICVFTGFTSGLPYFLLLQFIPLWLKNGGINKAEIGLFALTQVPYILKFVWAPFMDRYSLFSLGRRRSWMLFSQLVLFLLVILFAFLDPHNDLFIIALISLTVAFFSATLDIAVDAYRREILSDNELGLGNTIHINAYRVAGLVPGSLSLILTHYLLWQTVFVITALFILPGIIITLLIKEPTYAHSHKKRLAQIIIEPFLEFFQRNGIMSALLIVAFIFLYKLGDSMATSLISIFYIEMGFSELNIGLVAKNANFWPSIIGAFLGGLIMLKIGINKALWIFGFVQLTSIFGFIFLAHVGPFEHVDYKALLLLGAVVSFEYLGVGLGTAAFIAFIARTTNPNYTATQFALFSSIAAIPRTFMNATAGYIVNELGWSNFFSLCVLLAIPGMLLLLKVAPWKQK